MMISSLPFSSARALALFLTMVTNFPDASSAVSREACAIGPNLVVDMYADPDTLSVR